MHVYHFPRLRNWQNNVAHVACLGTLLNEVVQPPKQGRNVGSLQAVDHLFIHLHHLGKFHHDLTVLPKFGNHDFFREIIPFDAPTIQIGETF